MPTAVSDVSRLRVWCLGVSCLGAVAAAATAMSATAAVAEACAPHCDFNHYYGPYDFTYRVPLFGWPRCDAGGDCAPHLAYVAPQPWPRRGGRITLRLNPRP